MKKILFLCFVFCMQIFAFDTNFASFASDFIQSVSSANAKIRYEGNFILSKDQAFWNYQEPMLKQIYIKENELFIIEPDLEQVIISPLENIPNLSQIFQNARKLNEQTFLAQYNQITYTIMLKDDEISSITYKDELDNEVLIELFNQRRNFTLDEAIFEPRIPQDYDILRN